MSEPTTEVAPFPNTPGAWGRQYHWCHQSHLCSEVFIKPPKDRRNIWRLLEGRGKMWGLSTPLHLFNILYNKPANVFRWVLWAAVANNGTLRAGTDSHLKMTTYSLCRRLKQGRCCGTVPLFYPSGQYQNSVELLHTKLVSAGELVHMKGVLSVLLSSVWLEGSCFLRRGTFFRRLFHQAQAWASWNGSLNSPWARGCQNGL